MVMKKFFSCTFVLLMLTVLSCTKEKSVAVTSVSLSQATAEMVEGETVQLSATVLPSDASDKSVVWSSSKQSVATVNNLGLITAISEGASTITASAGGKTATCQVTVSKKAIAVVSVELNKTSIELIEGNSEMLIATVKPDDATDKNVTWSSANAAIAAVDNGKVTAIKEGETTVTAKAGVVSATCKITVNKKIVAVESVELSKTEISLIEGETESLVATVKPEDATNKGIKWQSSNTDVAMVEAGLITAVAQGEAVITVTTDDGGLTAQCKVNVANKPVATAIFLEGGTWLYAADINQTFNLHIKTEPEDAHLELEWSVSDESLATISSSGSDATLVITDFGKGAVSVKDKYSGLSLAADFTTRVREFYWTENTGKTYDGKPLVEIEVGEEYQLHCSYSPESATRVFRKDMGGFRYNGFINTSPVYFSIDDNGKIKGLKPGLTLIETTIPVYKREGSVPLYVSVIPKQGGVESITLNKTEITLLKGKTETLTANLTPEGVTGYTITWTSSNPSIATVENGVITAISRGSTTITAEVDGQTATCVVAVVEDTRDAIYASYYGGAMTIINGKIQSGSKLNFGVSNYSADTIRIDSIQLIDGNTGNAGNEMSIGANLESGKQAVWTITIGATGIYSPTARFKYTYKGSQYTCEAKYVEYSW